MSSLEDLSGLESAKSTLRLEQIARLKARGVGEHVDLPQLVVCGDQSAGKSSILEGITGLPFPRQDGVCTKFPTEIILRHSDGERVILATILPTASRTEQAKKDLQSYKRHLENFDELNSGIDRSFLLRNIGKQQKKNSRDCARTKSSSP